MPEQPHVEQGSDLAVRFIAAFTTLAAKIDVLSARINKLEDTLTSVVSRKIEDLTLAMDDHRKSLDEAMGAVDMSNGVLATALDTIVAAGEIDKAGDPVGWTELAEIIKKIQSESQDDSEDDENDNDED